MHNRVPAKGRGKTGQKGQFLKKVNVALGAGKGLNVKYEIILTFWPILYVAHRKPDLGLAIIYNAPLKTTQPHVAQYMNKRFTI